MIPSRSWSLVLFGCSLPLFGILLLGAPLPLDARGDALVHALGAAWLTWLALRILDLRGARIFAVGVPAALFAAAISEAAQGLLTRNRLPGIDDLLADAVGVLLAALLWAAQGRALRALPRE